MESLSHQKKKKKILLPRQKKRNCKTSLCLASLVKLAGSLPFWFTAHSTPGGDKSQRNQVSPISHPSKSFKTDLNSSAWSSLPTAVQHHVLLAAPALCKYSTGLNPKSPPSSHHHPSSSSSWRSFRPPADQDAGRPLHAPYQVTPVTSNTVYYLTTQP